MIQSWKKLVTDRQTDESDFIGPVRLTSSVQYDQDNDEKGIKIWYVVS